MFERGCRYRHFQVKGLVYDANEIVTSLENSLFDIRIRWNGKDWRNFPKRVIERFSMEGRESRRMKSAEHAEGPRGGPIPVERGIGKKYIYIYIDPMTGVRGIFNKRFPSNDEDLINPSAGIKPDTVPRLGSIVGPRLILMTPFNPFGRLPSPLDGYQK